MKTLISAWVFADLALSVIVTVQAQTVDFKLESASNAAAADKSMAVAQK
jgi:hypothetical protein